MKALTPRYSHEEARHDLAAQAEGHLPDARLPHLENHLATCADCRAYQGEFLALEKSLGEALQAHLPEVAYSPAENQAFAAHLKTRIPKPRPLFQIPQWLNSLAWGGAVTLLMIGMAWILANTRLEEERPPDLPDSVLSLALSLTTPPGNRITFAGHGTPSNQVIFSPDSQLLASAYENGQVTLWQIADQTVHLQLDADPQGVASLAFSQNGALLLTLGQGNGTLKVWQAADGQLRQTLPDISGNPHFVGISSSGKIQLLRQPNEFILNATAGVDIPWAIRRGSDHLPIVLPPLAGDVVAASLSPDGTILATGAKSGMITLWEITFEEGHLQGNLLFRMEGHTGAITSLAFHPGGQWLVSAAEDGSARVWRIVDGVSLYTLLQETGVIHSLAFSPNGAALAASLEDGTVVLWMSTGE